MPTKCVCVLAEACDRNGLHWCEKNRLHLFPHEVKLCQTSAGYCRSLASGRSPQHVREAMFHGEPPPPPPPEPEKTAAQFPCVFRLHQIEERACNLCGLKGKPFIVYACGHQHGECSIGRKHSKVKSCVSCRDRVAPPVEVAEPVQGG